MTHTRRIARELALKALFQVDVGKQPLAEVLDGVLDQVRAPIYTAVNQAVKDAQAAVRGSLASALDEGSEHNARQLKYAARAAAASVGELGERAAGIARKVISERPPYGTEAARSELHDAAEDTNAALARISARPSLQPRLLEAVTRAALERIPDIEAAFARHLESSVHTSGFVTSLVHGALEHSDSIDSRLSQLAAHWSLTRQAAVDRNILRLAAYELLYEPEIPTGATINEAVELAKKYSTDESGRFVNGVLGALAGIAQGRTESAA